MDKKATMKRIAELTKSESWQEDKEIVAEVQKLGKSMWTEKPKRKTPRKIAIWHGDRILVTGTAEQLSDFQKFSLQFFFHAVHFHLCCLSLLTAFHLDPHHIIQSLDQICICLLQCFKVNYSTL